MQSKPLTPPTVSRERATHQQSCQQCECTMTALNSTAVHCSGRNCGKAPLCTNFWCKIVSLTVTRTVLTPPYKKNKERKNNFQNNCFVGVTTAHPTCMRCSNTRGAEWKLQTHLVPNKPWTCFTASIKINMFCLHLFLQEGPFKWGQCHRNKVSIVAFLRLNKIRRAV